MQEIYLLSTLAIQMLAVIVIAIKAQPSTDEMLDWFKRI